MRSLTRAFAGASIGALALIAGPAAAAHAEVGHNNAAVTRRLRANERPEWQRGARVFARGRRNLDGRRDIRDRRRRRYAAGRRRRPARVARFARVRRAQPSPVGRQRRQRFRVGVPRRRNATVAAPGRFVGRRVPVERHDSRRPCVRPRHRWRGRGPGLPDCRREAARDRRVEPQPRLGQRQPACVLAVAGPGRSDA